MSEIPALIDGIDEIDNHVFVPFSASEGWPGAGQDSLSAWLVAWAAERGGIGPWIAQLDKDNFRLVYRDRTALMRCTRREADGTQEWSPCALGDRDHVHFYVLELEER